MSLGPIRRIFLRYPVISVGLQAGGLMAAGDLISQKFIEKKPVSSLDFKRSARFGLLGLVIVGPGLRFWYGVLDKKVVFKSKAVGAFAKMGIDQVIMAPCFLANFMVLIGFLNHKNFEEIKADMREHYKDILMSNYKLWPATQVINFWVIPLQHRVLFVQTVALLWNTYLSYKTNRVTKSQSD